MSVGGQRRELRVGVALFVVALAIPFVASAYQLRVMNFALINAILVLGLNFVLGYAGVISLAMGAFCGVGAYVSALVVMRLGLSYWLALPISVLAAAVFAFVVGLPVLRLRGHYLALATLGLNEIVVLVANNWVPVTGGSNGIAGIPAPSLLGFKLDNDPSYFYLIWVMLSILTFAAYRIRRSHIGRAMIAVQDDEMATGTAGVNVVYLRTAAFIISAIYAGVAGNLLAHLNQFISPGDFKLSVSMLVLCMLVLGGFGSIAGSIAGALILTVLPELLRFLDKAYLIFYGCLMLLILIFLPRGLTGLVEDATSLLRRHRARPSASVLDEGLEAEAGR